MSAVLDVAAERFGKGKEWGWHRRLHSLQLCDPKIHLTKVTGRQQRCSRPPCISAGREHFFNNPLCCVTAHRGADTLPLERTLACLASHWYTCFVLFYIPHPPVFAVMKSSTHWPTNMKQWKAEGLGLLCGAGGWGCLALLLLGLECKRQQKTFCVFVLLTIGAW